MIILFDIIKIDCIILVLLFFFFFFAFTFAFFSPVIISLPSYYFQLSIVRISLLRFY